MSLEAAPCPAHPSAVDLYLRRPCVDREDIDPIHMAAEEWAEFLAKVKAGKFDVIGAT
ncbi:MAG: hypothetical protein ACRDMI_10385 [Streptosporangiaceae bacterium]